MELFISWHGAASKAVAEALRDWLPCVIQGLKPFLSSEDIHKGDVWFGEVSERLQQSTVGILCLTPDALHADWILFEAGALSKQVHRKRVIPLLLGLRSNDVAPPLSNFQAVMPEREDIFRMLQTINAARVDSPNEEPLHHDILRKSFDVWWPELNKLLGTATERLKAEPQAPRRSQEDILMELLELVRGLAQRAAEQAYASDVDAADIFSRAYLDETYQRRSREGGEARKRLQDQAEIAAGNGIQLQLSKELYDALPHLTKGKGGFQLALRSLLDAAHAVDGQYIVNVAPRKLRQLSDWASDSTTAWGDWARAVMKHNDL